MVLDAVGEKFGHTFTMQEVLAWAAAPSTPSASCLPEETVDDVQGLRRGPAGRRRRPEVGHPAPATSGRRRALLGLRKALGLFANLRPATAVRPAGGRLPPESPRSLARGMDIVVVRELTGGIYFGEQGPQGHGPGPGRLRRGWQYSEEEIRRIAKVAFDMAMKRGKHVTQRGQGQRAGVLPPVAAGGGRGGRRSTPRWSSGQHATWTTPPCSWCANPRQFDVIVTSNIFGDILSDEASQITGSIGMLPSASLAKGNFGMYEPVHGSAPDIAGQDKANPMATILSAAMMLRYTFGLLQEADAVENAVKAVLDQGYRTPDLFAGEGTLIGTAEMGRRIAEAI